MDPTMMNPMGFGPEMVSRDGPRVRRRRDAYGPRGFVLEKALPVVRLLGGLPFSAGEADVLEFFAGLEAVDALVVRSDGHHRRGVRGLLECHADGLRRCETAPSMASTSRCSRSKKAEYYHAVAAVREAQTNGGGGAFTSTRDALAATSQLAYGDAPRGDASVAGGGARAATRRWPRARSWAGTTRRWALRVPEAREAAPPRRRRSRAPMPRRSAGRRRRAVSARHRGARGGFRAFRRGSRLPDPRPRGARGTTRSTSSAPGRAPERRGVRAAYQSPPREGDGARPAARWARAISAIFLGNVS